ncbi:hypothetical protein PU560_14935 [Georgenia sp. 10Sc9-8]|uniref:DUF4232 domain-containing protein n=1 Tax=Georgenia halotolerans TaxID=3028317 RepID=A0ABT5U0H4_9MICO|nr:hypothetical protein [Georgenia halotolerans]
MASTRHDPPGRQPSRPAPSRRPSKAVYRRRRLVALLILLAVLALLVWGVSAVVGMVTDRGPGDAVAAESTQATDPGTADAPQPDGGAAASAAPADETGEREAETCAPDAVDTEVDSPAGVGPGEPVLFRLTLTNTGEEPCLLDTGDASLAVTAHLGEERVWSSADCAAGRAGREVLLEAGSSTTARVPWDKSRSASGCPAGQERAPAGTYQVMTSHDGAGIGAEGTLVLE